MTEVVKLPRCWVLRMLEDPYDNVIIIQLHCCSGVFCKSWRTLYCWSTQAAGNRRIHSSQ